MTFAFEQDYGCWQQRWRCLTHPPPPLLHPMNCQSLCPCIQVNTTQLQRTIIIKMNLTQPETTRLLCLICESKFSLNAKKNYITHELKPLPPQKKTLTFPCRYLGPNQYILIQISASKSLSSMSVRVNEVSASLLSNDQFSENFTFFRKISWEDEKDGVISVTVELTDLSGRTQQLTVSPTLGYTVHIGMLTLEFLFV
jgi:hypothetical protein